MYQDRRRKHILGADCYEFSVGGSEYEHLTMKKYSPASSTFKSHSPLPLDMGSIKQGISQRWLLSSACQQQQLWRLANEEIFLAGSLSSSYRKQEDAVPEDQKVWEYPPSCKLVWLGLGPNRKSAFEGSPFSTGDLEESAPQLLKPSWPQSLVGVPQLWKITPSQVRNRPNPEATLDFFFHSQS